MMLIVVGVLVVVAAITGFLVGVAYGEDHRG